MSDSQYTPRTSVLFQVDKKWETHVLPRDDIAISLKVVPELNEDGENISDNPGHLIRHKRMTVQERKDLMNSIDLEFFGVKAENVDE